jgi:hypothetical protein
VYTLLTVLFSVLNLCLPSFAAVLVHQRRRGRLVTRRGAPDGEPRQAGALWFYVTGMVCEACATPLYAVVVARFGFRLVPAWVVFLYCISLGAGMALFTMNYLRERRHGLPALSQPTGAAR